MPTLTQRDDGVFLLHLGDDGNRFTVPWLDEALEHVATVAREATDGTALVTTAGGPAYGLGIDLGWVRDHPDALDDVLDRMHELWAAILELPVPTVAAIHAHAFAGGAILAAAHDRRVMRADRGFFCFPEVDGRLPFTPGATALLTARFPIQAIHEAMIAARRYGGEDARAAGFVEATAPEDGVLDAALRDARALGGKDPATVGAIKRTTWAPVLATLRDRPANRVPMDVFAQAIAMLGS